MENRSLHIRGHGFNGFSRIRVNPHSSAVFLGSHTSNKKWSEAGDKWLKEKLSELCSSEAEPEGDFEVSEKPKDVEPIKKKGHKKVKK